MSNLRAKLINSKWRPQVKRFGTWKDIVDLKNNIREFRKEADAHRILEAFEAKGRGAQWGWKARAV